MKTHRRPPARGRGAGGPGGGRNPLARGGMAGFPMIGKKFSNGWKKRGGFSNDWKKFSGDKGWIGKNKQLKREQNGRLECGRDVYIEKLENRFAYRNAWRADGGDNLDNSGHRFQGRRAPPEQPQYPLRFALGINQSQKVTRLPNSFENDLCTGRGGGPNGN